MGMIREKSGITQEGHEVTKYYLENQNGMKLGFLDFGAVITNIWVPDRNGKLEDVVLGYDDIASYEVNVPSFGAPIGRYANRISEGKIIINDTEYSLDRNDKTNCLHGGFARYNYKMYQTEYVQDELGHQLIFSRKSPDGEQGFPGNFDYSITYTLTEDNELMISYQGVCDQDTAVSMTNHSYFNLGEKGHCSGSVLNHEVKIDAQEYTPMNEKQVPTGQILSVCGTPLDFKDFKSLGKDLVEDELSPYYFPGYDHNFVLSSNQQGEVREVAQLRNVQTGRLMRVFTDLPGMQLYTAPELQKELGKGGAIYNASCGVCFESQNFPNAINVPKFPNGILRAGDVYSTTTVYKFQIF